MKKRAPSPVNALLAAVRALSGTKILTLSLADFGQAFDIDEAGQIGYHPSHERLLRAKLKEALQKDGGLIIRQFLPLKIERVLPSGKKAWLPQKNIYGVFLGGGTWTPLPAAEVRLACQTDAETGAPLPPEEGVFYRDLPLPPQ